MTSGFRTLAGPGMTKLERQECHGVRSLAWNTKRLMEKPAGGQKVEYHFLSGRRLRDGAVISADPDHSSAGGWVVSQGPYAVSVLTRPTYALPQRLCLSFTCHTRKVEASGFSSWPAGGRSCVRLCRPPLGFRPPPGRGARRPSARRSTRHFQPSLRSAATATAVQRPPDCSVKTMEMNAIIDGIGRSEDRERIDAVFAAMRLYYSAIGSAHYDPSVAVQFTGRRVRDPRRVPLQG